MSHTPALPDDAVSAALAGDWQKAININSSIILADANNIDALNRLAFAYWQIGKIKEAKKTYETVLDLDKYNTIAQKNLHKLNARSSGNNNIANPSVSPLMFLEDPGKTKIVPCVNLAPSNVLTQLHCGQHVEFRVKKNCIELRDKENTYLGALPDDISFKLGKYISGGNVYSVIVRSIGKNALTVFIREITRGKTFINQPSFTPASVYVAQNRVRETRGKVVTAELGEQEDNNQSDEEQENE